MRDYRKKVERYRLPIERRNELLEFCRSNSVEARALAEKALDLTYGDQVDILREWIFRGTVLGWKWAKLEVNHIPCGADTYRYYRARFLWYLDKLLRADPDGQQVFPIGSTCQ